MLSQLRLRIGVVLVAALALGSVTQIAPAYAIDVPPAAAPVLVAPNAGATTSVNPVFSWSRVSGADKYRIQVAPTDTFTSPSYSADTINLHATPLTQLPTGTLFWRVAGLKGTAAGPFSEVRSLTREWSSAPTLSSPVDEAELTYPTQAPLLTWQPLLGASSYQVAVANNAEFLQATTTTTYNTSYAPTLPRTPDQPFYWRVQGVSGVLNSAWSETRSFTARWPATPTLREPANTTSATLQDVRLRWDPVAGATAYQLQISPNGDWANNLSIGPTTNGLTVFDTSYTLNPSLPNASYFWRVQALDNTTYATSNRGLWSSEWQFTKGMPAKPTLLTPASPSVISELKLSWTPVPLAGFYEVNISTDPNFASDALTQTCTTNHTAWTPVRATGSGIVLPGGCEMDTTTLVSGVTQYWRVRGADAPPSGLPVFGAWSNTHNFIYAPIVPVQVAPDGEAVRDVALDWEPVRGAKKYVVTVYKATQAVAATAQTLATSYTVTGLNTADGPFTWTVQSMDDHGLLSAQQGFGDRLSFTLDATLPTYSADANVTAPLSGYSAHEMPTMTWQPVEGATKYQVIYRPAGSPNEYTLTDAPIKATTYTHPALLAPGDYTFYVMALAEAGNIISTGGVVGAFTIADFDIAQQHAGCTPEPCTPTVAATPTLTWDPVPTASGYRVLIAYDKDFTNPYRRYTVQTNTVTPRDSLLDNQAGQAFYWFVVPCRGTEDTVGIVCGRNDDTVWPANTKSFRKVSAPVALVSPPDDLPGDGDSPVASQPIFSWTDYLTTNGSLVAPLTPVTQSAREYKLTVSAAEDFSGTPIDEVFTDATSYTPYNKTYPDGPLYWRVSAIDGSRNVLTASASRRVVKDSGKPAIVAPVVAPPTGPPTQVSGVPYLSWLPQAGAASYDVEIYKNGDTEFSATNKLTTTWSGPTRMAAWTPTGGLSAGTYAWRVRAVDASLRKRGWSVGLFALAASAPVLTAPADGSAPTAADGLLFNWQSVPGAAKYTFEMSMSPTFASTNATTTVMTSWAPSLAVADGLWYWRVKALDGAANVLSTSTVRTFIRDAKAPTVVLATPVSNLPVLGPIDLTFSEAVTGVTGASLTLRAVSTGSVVGATVTTPSATTARLVPLAPLLPGESYQVSAGSAIADLLGNALVATTFTVKVSGTVDNASPVFGMAWDRDSSSSASGGAYINTALAGSRARFSFTGTTATVLGVRTISGGYADVYLDGVKQSSPASFYASSTKWKVAVWTKSGLAAGPHTVEVVARGTHPSGSKGNYVYIDAFRVGTAAYEETSAAVKQSWRKGILSSASAGSYAVATMSSKESTGPYSSLRFYGSSVLVTVCRTNASGFANVYVDGVLKKSVDLYAASTSCNVTGVSVTGLVKGVHTVKVVVSGTRRTGSKGYNVHVDGFTVA